MSRLRGSVGFRAVALALLAVALVTMTGCGSQAAQEAAQPPAAVQKEFIIGDVFGRGEEPRRGGAPLIAQREDPPSAWEPMRVAGVNLGHVSRSMTGDGNLLKPCRDDVGKICLGVAERWEANPAFTEYTFKIRDNVLWHDGKPFTAEDVKFWFDLGYFGVKVGDKVRGPARAKAEMGEIKQVSVLPGNQVRVTLEGPDPLWSSKLAQIDMSQIPVDKAGLGSRVVVEDEQTKVHETYSLVFGDSVEFEEGHVSMGSPIGRALVGKGVGDEAILKLPAKTRRLKIVELVTIHQGALD